MQYFLKTEHSYIGYGLVYKFPFMFGTWEWSDQNNIFLFKNIRTCQYAKIDLYNRGYIDMNETQIKIHEG